MAQESSSQEKTEDATPKRLREARKKGQVAKSRDLNTIVILIVACGLIVFMAPYMQKQLQQLLINSFQFAGLKDIHDESLLQFLSEAFWTFLCSNFCSHYNSCCLVSIFCIWSYFKREYFCRL